MSSIPINTDREKVLYLLELIEKRQDFDSEKARELKPLLEKEYIRVLQQGKNELARKIAYVVVTLNSIIAGETDLRHFDRISIS